MEELELTYEPAYESSKEHLEHELAQRLSTEGRGPIDGELVYSHCLFIRGVMLFMITVKLAFDLAFLHQLFYPFVVMVSANIRMCSTT